MPNTFYIKYTAKLNSGQQAEIHRLLKDSARYDGFPYDCFVENNLNCFDNLPCFYLLYSSDNELICFVSLFLDRTEETATGNLISNLFIYGITQPEFRHHHHFSKLLHSVFQQLKQYSLPIECIYFPVNTKMQKNTIKHYLNSNTISYEYSEYLMKKNLDNLIFTNKGNFGFSSLPELEYEENEYGNEYSLWIEDIYIGGCLIEYINKAEAMIYQFGITDEEQGKGYGKLGLLLICQDLKNRHYALVSLQVTGKNKKAHRLYTDCGFEIIDEIQYFMLNKL